MTELAARARFVEFMKEGLARLPPTEGIAIAARIFIGLCVSYGMTRGSFLDLCAEAWDGEVSP